MLQLPSDEDKGESYRSRMWDKQVGALDLIFKKRFESKHSYCINMVIFKYNGFIRIVDILMWGKRVEKCVVLFFKNSVSLIKWKKMERGKETKEEEGKKKKGMGKDGKEGKWMDGKRR